VSSLPSLAAALRRKLLAKPGFTYKPVCGACGRQTEPRDFGHEFCKACEAEREAMSLEWERQRWEEVTGGPRVQHPPMYDCPQATEPFLPDDEPDHAEEPGGETHIGHTDEF
jgi:hypothetical protein